MRIRGLAVLARIAVLFTVSGAVSEAQALRPWIFPIQPQKVSSCQALYSEKELNSFLMKYGVKLPRHETLNINWSSGNIALAISTIGGTQPAGMDYGLSDDPNLLLIGSTPSKDMNSRLFVVEWDTKMHQWKKKESAAIFPSHQPKIFERA